MAIKQYVQHIPNRGYRVALLSEDRRRELRELRVVMEVHAAAGVLEGAGPDDIAELRKLAQQFEDAIQRGGPPDQIAANDAFHQRFYAIGPNRTLYEQLIEFRRRAVAMVVTPWRSVHQMESASREHFAMVDALEKRDLESLRDLIRQHIEAAARAKAP